MIIKLLHYLGIVEGVYLIDSFGEVYLTCKRKNPFNTFANVYPVFRVGHVVLHEDGTCSGTSCYIKEWKPLK